MYFLYFTIFCQADLEYLRNFLYFLYQTPINTHFINFIAIFNTYIKEQLILNFAENKVLYKINTQENIYFRIKICLIFQATQ